MVGHPGGVSWRCVLRVQHGGASWRCVLRVHHGGASWWCFLGVCLKSVSWICTNMPGWIIHANIQNCTSVVDQCIGPV